MAFTFTCCCILKSKDEVSIKSFGLQEFHEMEVNVYFIFYQYKMRHTNFVWNLNLEMPIPYFWYLGHISETPAANAIWLLNKRRDPLFFSSCYCSVIKHNLHHIMCLTLCLNCSRTFETMIWLFQSTSQKCILILK